MIFFLWIENQDVWERSKQFIYDVITGICRSKCGIQDLIRSPFKYTVELNLIHYLTKYKEQVEAYQIKTKKQVDVRPVGKKLSVKLNKKQKINHRKITSKRVTQIDDVNISVVYPRNQDNSEDTGSVDCARNTEECLFSTQTFHHAECLTEIDQEYGYQSYDDDDINEEVNDHYWYNNENDDFGYRTWDDDDISDAMSEQYWDDDRFIDELDYRCFADDEIQDESFYQYSDDYDIMDEGIDQILDDIDCVEINEFLDDDDIDDDFGYCTTNDSEIDDNMIDEY